MSREDRDDLSEFIDEVIEGNADMDRDSTVTLLQTPQGVEDSDDLQDEKPRTSDLCQWQYFGDGHWMASGPTEKTLPVGVYAVVQTKSGLVYQTRPMQTDGVMRFKDNVSDMIIDQIRKFWEIPQERFDQFQYLRKRGFMLYGPPGSGKTITIKMAIQDIVEMGGTVFVGEDLYATAKGINQFRKIEPDRPIICIFEDVDDLVSRQGDSDILSLMDGEQTVNNIVFIATTNYPKRLDSRLVNRPSRFDLIVRVGMPDPEVRRQYLGAKGVPDDDLDRWVDGTDGFGFAHMKELIITVMLLGNDYEVEQQRLKKMNRLTFKTGTSIGFGGE